MASAWVERRAEAGGVRYRVRYRLGRSGSRKRFAGSFRTMREAAIRRNWIAGELAARRVPDLAAFAEPTRCRPCAKLPRLGEPPVSTLTRARARTIASTPSASSRTTRDWPRCRSTCLTPSAGRNVFAELGEALQARDAQKEPRGVQRWSTTTTRSTEPGPRSSESSCRTSARPTSSSRSPPTSRPSPPCCPVITCCPTSSSTGLDSA